MTNRITWEVSVTGGYDGFILGEARSYKAKIHVFSIRHTPARHFPYLLAHRLPFRGIERSFSDIREAQKHAERYLLWAFELMGFEPAEGK